MTHAQAEQLRRITIRWAQAHRRRDLMDWHSQTGMLINMASHAPRESPEDREFASDLYLLAGLSYYRSLEFSKNLGCLPPLMSATA